MTDQEPNPRESLVGAAYAGVAIIVLSLCCTGATLGAVWMVFR